MTVNLRDLLVLLSGVAAASQVSALSLGNSQGNVQLGSPMDLVFQLKPVLAIRQKPAALLLTF